MDDKDRNVLNEFQDLIVQDLHSDVIKSLTDRGVINQEEYLHINCKISQLEKNYEFLNILCNKKNGLEPFMDALKDWYWWIEENLRKSWDKGWTLVISSTNIPPTPLRNVSRTSLLSEVRTALNNLQKGHYVVLHGMSGCGKSSLAAEALHHDLLVNKFQAKVYWLNCCQHSEQCKQEHRVGENELLALQVQLNEKISNNELNVGSASTKKLNVMLRKRMEVSDFKDGLIVLDDVCSAQVVEALNVGCKVMVISTNLDVMRYQGNHYTAIKVNEGFTEEESLQYFAKCVDLNSEDLPDQARQIHLHGKGHPLIVSLIGAQLAAHKEEASRNFATWDPYLDVLVTKNYGHLKRWSQGGEYRLTRTIDLCINGLTREEREKYNDFTLFVEDVNIDMRVLEILWDLPSTDVKNITKEFIEKSLLVRKYNPATTRYVYGIHDLLLDHLKNNLGEEACKKLHCKLIERYKEISNGDISLLPINDNYFFYYVGHHIAHAQQYHLFQEWYFDLNFIASKIKVAGAGDLLLDYKRYSDHFADGYFDQALIGRKLNDFVKFVESAGMDVRRNNGPDIVQLALQGPQDSEVYKIALRLLYSRPKTTYLRFPLGPSNSRSGPHLIQLKEKVSSVCFLKDTFIVGFESGVIQIMDHKANNRVIRLYDGHSSVVTGLNVRHETNLFLSFSKNSVKVWLLPDLDSSVSHESGDRTPSPSQRQTDFTYLFDQKPLEKMSSFKDFKYDSVVFWAVLSNTKLAFCCEDKTVQVRDVFNGGTLNIRVPGTCCVFFQKEELLVIGCSNCKVIIHNITTNRNVSEVTDSYPLLALFLLPASEEEFKIGALTAATLCVWELIHPQFMDHNKTIPCLRDYNKGETELYRCCSASSDGSAVAVATSSSKILVCELNSGTVIRELSDSSCNVKWMHMDNTKEHKLLACGEDSCIKLWTLGDLQSGKPASMRKNFVVAWKDVHTPILVAPTYQNCVKKIIGSSKFEEDLEIPVHCEVNVCAISRCSRIIAASTSDKEVYIYIHGNGTYTNKMEKIHKMCREENVMMMKVDSHQNTLCVVVVCERSATVWVCEEEGSILKRDTVKTFKKSFKERLVDFFVDFVSKELITVTQNGSVKKHQFDNGSMERELCESRFDVKISDADLSCRRQLVSLDSLRHFLNIFELDNIEDGLNMKQVELTSNPLCCSFSYDGLKLAVGFQEGTVQVWDMVALNKQETVSLESPVTSVCVSRRGLVGAATERRVVMKPENCPLGQAKLQVGRVIMSPDDKTMVTVDADGHMHLIEVFTTTSDRKSLNLLALN